MSTVKLFYFDKYHLLAVWLVFGWNAKGTGTVKRGPEGVGQGFVR